MSSFRKFFGALVAACFVTAGFAADPSPAGTWKWTVQGRQGAGLEQTLKLDYKEGKLTGTLLGVRTGQFQVPDTEISDASYKDGHIKFAVTREFNGKKFTTRYEGKLERDAIKGTSERPNIQGGEPLKREWVAIRVDWGNKS